jgi:hypothetical protein
MQQFVVPQFIDVEDKIIGPITVRQFLILLVGSGIDFIAYKLSDFALFIFEFLIISTFTFVFAFIKVNGRPIHYLLLNFLQTVKRPKIRIWHKKFLRSEFKDRNKNKKINLPPMITTKTHVHGSRLAELSLIVDTGGVYQGEDLSLSPEELS